MSNFCFSYRYGVVSQRKDIFKEPMFEISNISKYHEYNVEYMTYHNKINK